MRSSSLLALAVLAAPLALPGLAHATSAVPAAQGMPAAEVMPVATTAMPAAGQSIPATTAAAKAPSGATGGASKLGGAALGGGLTAPALLAGPSCPAGNAALTRLTQPLPRLAKALRDGTPVTIVAIGSSSTAGAGASSPAGTYPSRLEALLRERFPQAQITVLNRGINGQDAPEMLARFDADVAAARPTLVLWQAGVNALFREHGLDTAEALLREAVSRTRAIGADMVIIDPQYSPKVIADSEALDMLGLQQRVGDELGVSVFHRFALMRDWHEKKGLAFDAFTFRDGFHMNDWGYDCIARGLTTAVAANVDAQLRSADLTAPAGKAGASVSGTAASAGTEAPAAAPAAAPQGLPEATATP